MAKMDSRLRELESELDAENRRLVRKKLKGTEYRNFKNIKFSLAPPVAETRMPFSKLVNGKVFKISPKFYDFFLYQKKIYKFEP
jgi:hypothetical protein